jgi:hypothetical protein
LFIAKIKAYGKGWMGLEENWKNKMAEAAGRDLLLTIIP